MNQAEEYFNNEIQWLYEKRRIGLSTKTRIETAFSIALEMLENESF